VVHVGRHTSRWGAYAAGGIVAAALGGAALAEPPAPRYGVGSSPEQRDSAPPTSDPQRNQRGSPNAPLFFEKVSASEDKSRAAQDAQKESHEYSSEELTNKIALGALVAAFLQFVALIITVFVMRSAARRQFRAYCGPIEFRTHLPHLGDPTFEVPDPAPPNYVFTHYIICTVQNFGTTPAFDLNVVMNWQPVTPFGSSMPEEFEYPDQRKIMQDGGTVVDPGQTFPALIVVNPVAGFREAKAKRATLYLYGNIDYTDAFKRRWRRTFCVTWEPWNPVGLQFIPYRTHNDEKRI
jgi:hypothetical protein